MEKSEILDEIKRTAAANRASRLAGAVSKRKQVSSTTTGTVDTGRVGMTPFRR